MARWSPLATWRCLATPIAVAAGLGACGTAGSNPGEAPERPVSAVSGPSTDAADRAADVLRDVAAAEAEAARRADRQFSDDDGGVLPVAPTDLKQGQRAVKRRTLRAHLEAGLLAQVARKHNMTEAELRRLLGKGEDANAPAKP